MGLLDKMRNRTITETINSVKETVSEAARNGIDEKLQGVLKALPALAALYLIFSGEGKSKPKRSGNPDRITVINNYYYGDEAVKQHVKGNH